VADVTPPPHTHTRASERRWPMSAHTGVLAGDRLSDPRLDETLRRVHFSADRLVRVAAARQSTGLLQHPPIIRADRDVRAVRDVYGKPGAGDAASCILARVHRLPVPTSGRHRVRGARPHQSQAAHADGDPAAAQRSTVRRRQLHVRSPSSSSAGAAGHVHGSGRNRYAGHGHRTADGRAGRETTTGAAAEIQDEPSAGDDRRRVCSQLAATQRLQHRRRL